MSSNSSPSSPSSRWSSKAYEYGIRCGALVKVERALQAWSEQIEVELDRLLER